MLPNGVKASIVQFVACCCLLQFQWKTQPMFIYTGRCLLWSCWLLGHMADNWQIDYTCPCHLGQCNTNRYENICVLLPKGAKASTSLSVVYRKFLAISLETATNVHLQWTMFLFFVNHFSSGRQYCTCLGHLGQHDTNRYEPIVLCCPWGQGEVQYFLWYVAVSYSFTW